VGQSEVINTHVIITKSRKPGHAEARRNQRRQGILDASASRCDSTIKAHFKSTRHIDVALRQKAITVEDAIQWAIDEGIIDLLQFGPPSKTEGKP
jgi:hypothetical protein